MTKKDSVHFRDFYADDNNLLSPAECAKIEFEVELIGKIIEARESRGLTQKQLAEAAGLNQSTVARLESLKATPQIDTLFKVLTPMGYKLTIVPNDESIKCTGRNDKEVSTGENGDMVIKNSAMIALKRVQNAFECEAKRLGLETEGDVVNLVKEVRKEIIAEKQSGK